jgi:flavin-dependent dehydrogenase
MNLTFEVVLIGGGLAGLSAAIHLAKAGKIVALFEKECYPRHKVCGEYVSNEIKEYLTFLGVDWDFLNPMNINKTQLSIASGQTISTDLPLGGMGLSRYELDFHLFQIAKEAGVHFFFENVENVAFENQIFTIFSKTIVCKAEIVLGSFGKRSSLDFKFKRPFLQKKSPWLGVKSHYHGVFPNDLVGLHHFEGGYCGVSKVNENTLNICYLVSYEVFQRFKNVQHFEDEILHSNPFLSEIIYKSERIFEKPLTISQISFESKNRIENHILMLGDAAGMIHPLCGNGMAMAMHSAKIASELVINFLNDKINRSKMEQQYVLQWNHHFKRRLFFGKLLSKALLNKRLNVFLMKLVTQFPSLLSWMIKKTHGKPIL